MSAPERLAVAGLLLLALAPRLWAASSPALSRWDEAHHALVAKHLATHPLEPTLFDDPDLPHDDLDWTRCRIFLNKPPLALWAMAASIRAFGATPLAARLPSVLLDLLAVGLTFAIARRLLGNRSALIAMGFHALLGDSLLLVGGVSPTDHVDSQLTFWVALGCYAVLRSREGSSAWAALAGVAAGAAVLTKGPPGLLPIALLALGCLRAPNARRALAGASVASVAAAGVAAPWNLYSRWRWPELASNAAEVHLRHLWVAYEGHTGHPLYHLEKLGEMHGVLSYLPVCWFLLRAIRDSDPGRRLVALWWLVPFVVYTVAATKMTHYLAIAAPAVCVMFGAFFDDCLRSPRRGSRLIAAAVAVASLVAFGRDLTRVSREKPGAAQFAQQMRSLPPKTVVLGVGPNLQAMFFGAHAAYPEIWSAEQQAAVSARGYQVTVAHCDGTGTLPIPAGYCTPQL